MSNAEEPIHPCQELDRQGMLMAHMCHGLSKRESFAGIAMHAEFLSCAMSKQSAEALSEAAAAADQSVERRISINALVIADAMLKEPGRP